MISIQLHADMLRDAAAIQALVCCLSVELRDKQGTDIFVSRLQALLLKINQKTVAALERINAELNASIHESEG